MENNCRVGDNSPRFDKWCEPGGKCMTNLQNVLMVFPWWAWIAIIGTVGWSVAQIVRMGHRHRERIEMIRQGLIPPDDAER